MVKDKLVYKPNFKPRVEELEQISSSWSRLWMKHMCPQWPTIFTSYGNASGC